MKFDLVSDLHVDINTELSPKERARYRKEKTYYPWREVRNEGSDVLVIAGDTSNNPSITMDVVADAGDVYERVVFTDGNHEHYVGRSAGDLTTSRNMSYMEGVARVYENVTYLNGTWSFQIGNTLFVGACLWYDFKATKFYSREQEHSFWKGGSNDSKNIRFSQNSYPDKLGRRQIDAITDRVRVAQNDPGVIEIVVVSHTVPLVDFLVPPVHDWYYLNGAYHHSESSRILEADTLGKIKVWCFGHTHEFFDEDRGRVRYVSNPRGYLTEKNRSRSFTGPIQIDTSNPPPKSAFGEIDD
jgi:predicted phosphodiesterase